MPIQNDETDWMVFAQSVQPLQQAKNLNKKEMSPRLNVRKTAKILLYTLDLHGKTLEEAHALTQTFLDRHFKKGSKQVTIITGKGLNNTGKIKNEIEFWFETPPFKEKIRSFCWENGGGVLKITLKRTKQNENGVGN